MSSQKLISFLQASGFIPPQKAEEIASRFTERTVAKGEYFLRAGQLSHEYLFLDTGFMRSYAIDTEGREVTTAFHSEGDVVFEVNAFFMRTPSMESIQAVTDCSGWQLRFETLNELFHNIQEFREFGRGVLVKGYAALKLRMLTTITETAEERYRRLLSSHPEIFQHASLKHIASYLGITDTSLSRIRKELAKPNQ